MTDNPLIAKQIVNLAEGRTLMVRPVVAQDRKSLERFYESFEPKRGAQGLPPDDAQRTSEWINSILSRGVHVLVEEDRDVVAHMMLVPLEHGGGIELATFVHQSARNRGIGTMLNKMGVELAKKAGYSRIWLSVEPSNTQAIRSYQNAGFTRVAGSLWAPEIEMEVTL